VVEEEEPTPVLELEQPILSSPSSSLSSYAGAGTCRVRRRGTGRRSKGKSLSPRKPVFLLGSFSDLR
jgi:hypothetical protein